jgi:hypothetical protein
MEHLLLKAVTTTTTDLGEFEAVISTSAIDREKGHRAARGDGVRTPSLDRHRQGRAAALEYLVPEGGSQKRAGGGRRIVQLDGFEITVTPAPMNAETRVLATKAIGECQQVRTKARDEMLRLFTATDPEPVAAKSVELPVQIASFDA